MQELELFGCAACKQNDCLINKYCSQKWKIFLGHNKLFREFPQKLNVFSEGEPVSRIYFIRYGKIKVYNTANTGKQNITRLACSGEMLGLRSFAEDTYLVSATTLEQTSLCSFEKKVFISVLKKNPEFAWHLMEFYAQQFSNFEIHHRNFAQSNAKGKIAEALLIIKKKFGVLNAEGGCLLDVVLSRQEIADVAGTCLAEAIRAVSVFKKENIIKINKQKITILNLEMLDQFIVEKCIERRKTA